MDLITNFFTVKDLDFVMVVVIHGLGKGVLLAPCTKMVNATRITQLVFNNVFKQFDLHEKIVSVADPNSHQPFLEN